MGFCCWRDFVVGLCCFGVVGLSCAGIVEELAPLHTPTRQKTKKKNKETKEEQEQGAGGREGEEMFSIGRVAMSSW